MLTFHATGDWDRSQVAVSQTADTRRRIPEIEAMIDRAWTVAHARPGVHLFDGPMCRFESWIATPDHLSIALSTTSYKSFVGTNLSHPELAERYDRTVLANPVGVSPALITSDGWIMMGRRNASVAYYPDRVHPFAGALEPRDAADLFSSVQRELTEELHFTPADVVSIHCTGIAEDRSIRQPELIFRVDTHRTREQVEATLDRTEHHATWAISATMEAVDQTLANFDELTPVAVASMLLWGKTRWGAEWFNARILPLAASR